MVISCVECQLKYGVNERCNTCSDYPVSCGGNVENCLRKCETNPLPKPSYLAAHAMGQASGYDEGWNAAIDAAVMVVRGNADSLCFRSDDRRQSLMRVADTIEKLKREKK